VLVQVQTMPVTNSPPVVELGSLYTANEGSAVSIDGTTSNDPDGDNLTYTWVLGDGATASDPAVTHVYADDGTYIASLTVTDPAGASSTQMATVTIVNVAPTL